jgi:hypothetical protein
MTLHGNLNDGPVLRCTIHRLAGHIPTDIFADQYRENVSKGSFRKCDPLHSQVGEAEF